MSERLSYFINSMLTLNAKKHRADTPALASINFDAIGANVASYGFYEKPYLEMLASHVFPKLKADKICLDIGANIGNHSVFFSKYFEKIWSFEPNPRVLKVLEANAFLAENITPVGHGLSDKSQTLEAGYRRENVGAAALGRSDDVDVTVEFKLEKLDDFLSENGIESVDFIKIDVEGHELQVLHGATNLLAGSEPVIVLEALEAEVVDGTTMAMNFLRESGYEFVYRPMDTAPFSQFSTRLAKAVNALSVLFFNKRLLDRFILTGLDGPLEEKNYPMLVFSKYRL